MNGVDGEWVLGVFVGMSSSLQEALITVTKPLTKLLPQPVIIVQGLHEEVLVAVEDVLSVPMCVEKMQRLRFIAARHNAVSGISLYEGTELPALSVGAPDCSPLTLVKAGLQRSLQYFVNV